MAFLRSILFTTPLVGLATVFFGTIAIVVSFFDSHGRTQMRVARAWARSLLRITGTRVTVEGLERIHTGGSYVFVSNHLSYMDTPVVLSSVPSEFRFLAKRGLFQIPFLGTHLAQAGHVPVPREDPRAAVKTLSHAGEIIRTHGTSILVFPEGGRSMDGVLQEFKDGASFIAIKAQVPVVPLALIGTREVLPMGSGTIRAGNVRLLIGDPIPTVGMASHNRRELTRVAREQVAVMLDAAQSRVPRYS
jgi:1-acyl-sn-glycerol-3-phosphate acyltransferase